MNDCITTTKQSTTKPCAYFLGYTVISYPGQLFIRYYDNNNFELLMFSIHHLCYDQCCPLLYMFAMYLLSTQIFSNTKTFTHGFPEPFVYPIDPTFVRLLNCSNGNINSIDYEHSSRQTMAALYSQLWFENRLGFKRFLFLCRRNENWISPPQIQHNILWSSEIGCSQSIYQI